MKNYNLFKRNYLIDYQIKSVQTLWNYSLYGIKNKLTIPCPNLNTKNKVKSLKTEKLSKTIKKEERLSALKIQYFMAYWYYITSEINPEDCQVVLPRNVLCINSEVEIPLQGFNITDW